MRYREDARRGMDEFEVNCFLEIILKEARECLKSSVFRLKKTKDAEAEASGGEESRPLSIFAPK